MTRQKIEVDDYLLGRDDEVQVFSCISLGRTGWLNGKRLEPGQVVKFDGVQVHVEPDYPFRIPDELLGHHGPK